MRIVSIRNCNRSLFPQDRYQVKTKAAAQNLTPTQLGNTLKLIVAIGGMWSGYTFLISVAIHGAAP